MSSDLQFKRALWPQRSGEAAEGKGSMEEQLGEQQEREGRIALEQEEG